MQTTARNSNIQLGTWLPLTAVLEIERAAKVTLCASPPLACFLPGRTVVCTIGGKPAPLVQQLAAAKVRGRLEVAPDMALTGRVDAWAIGDCAAVANAHDGRPSPSTGQFAERQGVQLAHNIAARLAGCATRPVNPPLRDLTPGLAV